jgi:pimeloyl-ACP methyl ester carboxylesterase
MKRAQEVLDTHQSAPTQFVDANGITFAYRRIGPSLGVPLILLQHFRGNMDNWDPVVVDGLAYERPVILFDNRGIGRTTGETPDNVGDMADDAAAFIEALDEKRVDLLGFSLGGMVAQQLLLDRSELIGKTILVGTGPRGSVDVFPPEVEKAATKYPSDPQSLLFLFFENTPASQAAGRRYLERMMLRTEREPETTEQVMRAHLAAIREWTRPAGVSQSLARVSQPVLVVNGRHDIMIPTINAYTLSQQLPKAELIVYPDSGHGSLFQYPERFARDAAAFFSEDPFQAADAN